MATINRERFLRQLETVRPGLSPKGIIEQSSCFVFRKGNVYTYNEQIFCRNKSELPNEFTGAVEAAPLLAVLTKLPEEGLEIGQTDSEFTIKGKGRGSHITMQDEVKLPINTVEKPKDWKPLHEDFSEAIGLIQECAGKDETLFSITCVHIHPKWVEATDDLQGARYRMKTGVEQDILVKRDSIKHIVALDMTEFCETETWIHFRNPSGLILSCHRFIEMSYPNLQPWLEVQGQPAVLPKGLIEAAERAEIFSSEDKDNNNVKIELRPGKLRIHGIGDSGKYWEVKSIKYKGKPLTFIIPPKLLVELTKRYTDCFISPETLKIEGGKFTYVACLEQQTANPKEEEADEDAED